MATLCLDERAGIILIRGRFFYRGLGTQGDNDPFKDLCVQA